MKKLQNKKIFEQQQQQQQQYERYIILQYFYNSSNRIAKQIISKLDSEIIVRLNRYKKRMNQSMKKKIDKTYTLKI